jgi:hypothetical protein
MRMEASSHSPPPSLPPQQQHVVVVDGPVAERGGAASNSLKERKVVHNASSKVSLVVQKMLLPLLDTPMRTHVVFDVESDQVELDLMDQLGRTKPEVLDDSTTFVKHLQILFDRYRQGFCPTKGAYTRVSPAHTAAITTSGVSSSSQQQQY